MQLSQGKEYPTYLAVNGKHVPYAEAAVHPLSTSFKYGAIVFEGLRGYWNAAANEVFVFRVREHLRRLQDSCLLTGIPFDVPEDRLESELLDLIRQNDLRSDMHIRIQVFVDTDDGAIASTTPVSYVMATMPMQRYFQTDGLHVAVSSWRRISDRSMPPRIKAVPNYHNGRLAILQAKKDGYDDVLLLTDDGKVAEGPGYAIFIARDGVLCTPPTTDGILESITRDSILRIAKDRGLTVQQRSIDRTELYLADEAFFCGSAAEVMPILSFDRTPVGGGSAGPLTTDLRGAYLSIVRGDVSTNYGWLTSVYGADSGAVTVVR